MGEVVQELEAVLAGDIGKKEEACLQSSGPLGQTPLGQNREGPKPHNRQERTDTQRRLQKPEVT